MKMTRFYCPDAWGLTPQEAHLVEAIVSADGMLTRQQALRSISRVKDENIVKVVPHRVKRKLAPFNIEILTIWGMGLHIEDSAKAALRAGAVHLEPMPTGARVA